MAIADGYHRLSRVAFKQVDVNGNVIDTFNFAINPQNIQEQVATRTSYINTAQWGSVQELGTGERTITISGTTGWRQGLGFEDYKKLRLFLTAYTDSRMAPPATSSLRYLEFWNYTDDYWYDVAISPNGYSFTQDVSEPILVRYSITMIVRGSLDTASTEDKSQTLITDPYANNSGQSNLYYSNIGYTVRQMLNDGK